MKLRSLFVLLVVSLCVLAPIHAELRLPAIFGDRMVLQQQRSNPVWGWDVPGHAVTVLFGGDKYETHADENGRWTVHLAPRVASDAPMTLTVAGSTQVQLNDVLIGEVWICSGQSNMQFDLATAYSGDLEAAASDYPALRLLTVPQLCTQQVQEDFKAQWQLSTPATARQFSAVGLLYGRLLHQILRVPVGLIDVSFGGSPAEAWMRRETLDRDPRFAATMSEAARKDAHAVSPAGQAEFAAALAKWKEQTEAARAQGKTPPFKPRSWLEGQHRPGNLFAGMLHPVIGYGIRGVIWYQGEGNAARAAEYNELFPFLIQEWRREWGQGDFSFYWAQLADHSLEVAQPGESKWAELREAQTRTLRLPQTGQAVTLNLGEGRDIHPRAKYEVALRLARWALVHDYGREFAHRSPEFKSIKFDGPKAEITFDCFGSELYTFDVREPIGFAICGADRKWVWAQAELSGKDRVTVWSDEVPAPIAVRYAWADNPRCNLQARSGLPVTPFRTDDFPSITQTSAR